MGKQETKPTKVDKIPEGYKKGRFEDGIQYYEIKGETPPLKPTSNPPKSKSKPPVGKSKPKPYLPPPPTKPTDFKKEVFMEEPNGDAVKQETVLNNGVKGYGIIDTSNPNQDYDIRKFPDETGNYTNNAQKLYFKKGTIDEIAKPDISHYVDGKFTPIPTGRKLDDIRLSEGVQQVNKATDSGLNNRIDVKAPFLKSGSVIDINSQGGQGITPNTVNKTVTGATDVYIPKKFDSLGKEIPTNSGLKPIGTPLLQGKEVGKMYDVEKPIEIKGKFAKGGIVSKVKGYSTGGGVYNEFGQLNDLDSGVVGQNDPYAAKQKEEQNKTNANQNARKVADTTGQVLGGVGSAYYNSQPTQNKGDATRNAGLAATSQMGGIGGMIGGIAALGDKIGKPIKNRSQQVDSNGELLDEGKAKRNAIIGITFSPSKRLSYEGGLTDVTGQKYLDSIENKTKAQLKQVQGANQASRQNQAVLARNNNEQNATITNPYDLSGAKFDENQNMILAKGQQFNNGQPLKKGGIVSKIQMCADGGKIVGKGGPKDDKILAKVKADSFIVPAENAEVAEELREKFLGKPPKQKANLNEKGGEVVKLSNGEHKFSKEEKEELLEKGVNVNLLAPNAEHKEEMMEPASKHNMKEERKEYMQFPKVVGMATGGEVSEEDTVDPKKEKERLAKEEADIKKSKDYTKSIEERVDVAKNIKKHRDFTQQVLIGTANRKAELEKEYNRVKNGENADYKGKDAVRERLKTLLDEIDAQTEKAKQTAKEYELSKNDSNYDASGNFKPTETTNKENVNKTTTTPKVTTTETPTTETKPSVRVPKSGSTVKGNPNSQAGKFVPTLTPDNGEEVIVSNGNISPNEAARIKATQDKATADATALNNSLPSTYTPTVATPTKKGGIMDKIGNIDPTSLIGIGQAAVGYNMLKDSKRPIDKAVIDPTYNTAVNRAQNDARFGLTPEQRFAAEQDIQGGLNDAKMAGLNASGVQSFNTNRAAINDAWKNKLGLKQADFDMRMQKQKYADAMAADRATILASNRRQAYNDAMGAFQQNQGAGSELIGAGLQNVIGAYRYNKAKDKGDEVEVKRNPYYGYKG